MSSPESLGDTSGAQVIPLPREVQVPSEMLGAEGTLRRLNPKLR